jgi:hypothetical protein
MICYNVLVVVYVSDRCDSNMQIRYKHVILYITTAIQAEKKAHL